MQYTRHTHFLKTNKSVVTSISRVNIGIEIRIKNDKHIYICLVIPLMSWSNQIYYSSAYPNVQGEILDNIALLVIFSFLIICNMYEHLLVDMTKYISLRFTDAYFFFSLIQIMMHA